MAMIPLSEARRRAAARRRRLVERIELALAGAALAVAAWALLEALGSG